MSTHARSWQLTKEDQGIRIYLAPMPGSDYKEYKVEFSVAATLTELVAINIDVPGTSGWMDGVEKSTKVEGTDQRYITHTLTKVPWPAKDRDAVAETWVEQDPESLVTYVRFHSVDGKVPLNKKYERVKSVKGFWQFTPKGNGMVDVVYQNHSEPGGSIPGWLANMFVVDVPLASVKNLLKAMKAGRYKSSVFEFVRNA
jgi:hypothetical protein